MRFTIERLRTLILAAGVLLIAALVGFLAFGHWKNKLSLKEIPKRLGANIEREANGFTYTQSHGGHTLFKIHASRVVQLKQDGRAQLHDVQIELYGQDGSTIDRIKGGEFQYDQKAGLATAAGPVEITIMRPAETTAVASHTRNRTAASPKAGAPLANAAQAAEKGEIDVKTSGLTFDQNSGAASTAQRVEFALVQGWGSSTGAVFDSNNGRLVLDRDVEMNIRRGSEVVHLRADHGEFERTQLTCDLRGASAGYRNGQATAGQARVLFRDDGSAIRLNASDGFALTSATGAKVTAPSGLLNFNAHNQPTDAQLEGGVTMHSERAGSAVSGSAPHAQLEFADGGVLRHAHLERGVTMHSEQNQNGAQVVRDWHSPVADIAFRNGPKGQLQMASVQGTGGVVITGRSQQPGGPALPSRMSADQANGDFGPNQELTRIIGIGHASMEQTTAAGMHQVTSGDKLEATLAPVEHATTPAPAKSRQSETAQQIQSANIDGHVVLTQQQPAKPGEEPPAPLRATAAHATYEGENGWLHLTGNPRIDDGSLQLAADKLDVSQAGGDAFAHGNVKATWLDSESTKTSPSKGGPTLGGQGPAHIVSDEAQLHHATNQATFRGRARLWQQATSVSAPEIVLDQTRQTLVARGSGPGQPVNLVLLGSGKLQPTGEKAPSGASTASVVRIRAGDLKYSSAERKAFLRGGPADPVLAETGAAKTSSNEAEIDLLPPGNHAGPNGTAAQVDKLTARGHVEVTSQGRRGTGEQLVYQGETGQYVLTGTPEAPPRMTDPVRGWVTGDALIFNSRDDSVSIEGQGQKTQTQTVAPR